MQPYSKEAVIFLAVLALATVVGIFCSGIRQNSCPLNELQDFWQSPLRFVLTIHHLLVPVRNKQNVGSTPPPHHHLIPLGFKLLAKWRAWCRHPLPLIQILAFSFGFGC